jgi:hypothetical protein
MEITDVSGIGMQSGEKLVEGIQPCTVRELTLTVLLDTGVPGGLTRASRREVVTPPKRRS